uniref:Amine oxidase n=1 Tax=Bicosoecida sp. CB-2014 TaxID=1486930 RepID=A0A7S1G5L0_9STRA
MAPHRPSSAAAAVVVLALAAAAPGLVSAQWNDAYIDDTGVGLWTFTRGGEASFVNAGTMPNDPLTSASVNPRPITYRANSPGLQWLTVGPATSGPGRDFIYLMDLQQTYITDVVGPIEFGDDLRIRIGVEYECITADCDLGFVMFDGAEKEMVGALIGDDATVSQIEGTADADLRFVENPSITTLPGDPVPTWSLSMHQYAIDVIFTAGVPGYTMFFAQMNAPYDNYRTVTDTTTTINAESGLHFAVVANDIAEEYYVYKINVRTFTRTSHTVTCGQAVPEGNMVYVRSLDKYYTSTQPAGSPPVDLTLDGTDYYHVADVSAANFVASNDYCAAP